MAGKIVADAVVAIPYGTDGKKFYHKVGVLLEMEVNNPDIGLGYVMLLDKHFNPAGIQTEGISVAISFYNQKEKENG